MNDPRYSPLLITPDTNVLVSGGTISVGAPSQIINVWRHGNIDFALSPPILDEVKIDPDDNMLFATAFEAGADYIVSGDEKHVVPIGEFEGIKVMSPKEFVSKVLEKGKIT